MNGGLIKDVESNRLIYFYFSDIVTILSKTANYKDPKIHGLNFNVGKFVFFNAIMDDKKVNIICTSCELLQKLTN